MSTPLRRRTAVLAVAALIASLFAVMFNPSVATAQLNTNGCTTSVSANAFELPIDVSGTAPATSVFPTTINVTAASGSITLPGTVLDAGLAIGAVAPGDTIPTDITVVVGASNTAEGTAVLGPVSVLAGPLVLNVPGDPTSGFVDALVPFSLPDSAWTPLGAGDVVFEEVSLLAEADLGFPLPVPFNCVPGTASTDAVPVVIPGPAIPFATTTVTAPPTPPTANDDATSVGATQTVAINILGNDTDPNGNIDPASVVITAPPTEGTIDSINPATGAVTYTNTNGSATSDTFQYTVADTGGLVSNVATVTIDILGDQCTVPAGGDCSLNQVLIVPVLGADLVLNQDGLANDFQVTMVDAASIAGPDGIPGTPDDTPASAAPITLNGSPQTAVGNLYQMTVTNSRGTDDGWTLSGNVTNFSDGTVPPTCDAADDTTWNNHCIPGDNLGWVPSAAVAHTRVLGDVAAIAAGSAVFPPGTAPLTGPLDPTGMQSSTLTLCSTASGTSGGTFTCDAGLALQVPASAAAGVYTALLTLTLA